MTRTARKEGKANFVTEPEHRAMFASARDFGLLITPIALGVFADAFKLSSPGLAILFVAGVGFALRLLSHLRELENWETKR